MKEFLSRQPDNKFVWNYYAELLDAGAPEYDYKMRHLPSDNEFAWDDGVNVRLHMYEAWPDYNWNLYCLAEDLCRLHRDSEAKPYVLKLIKRKMDPRLAPFARSVAKQCHISLEGSAIGP